VFDVAFSRSGAFVASANWSKTITIWNVATGKSEGNIYGHKSIVNRIAVSADGTMMASGDNDGEVLITQIRETRR